MKSEKKLLLDKIKKLDIKKRISFVVVYGSFLTKRYNKLSDIDIAIYYEGNSKERFKFRLALSGELPDRFDIHIFQDLPLYIKNEIVKNGKIIYKRDIKNVSAIYISVIRQFSRFEKYIQHYYEHLKGDALA